MLRRLWLLHCEPLLACRLFLVPPPLIHIMPHCYLPLPLFHK